MSLTGIAGVCAGHQSNMQHRTVQEKHIQPHTEPTEKRSLPQCPPQYAALRTCDCAFAEPCSLVPLLAYSGTEWRVKLALLGNDPESDYINASWFQVRRLCCCTVRACH